MMSLGGIIGTGLFIRSGYQLVKQVTQVHATNFIGPATGFCHGLDLLVKLGDVWSDWNLLQQDCS